MHELLQNVVLGEFASLILHSEAKTPLLSDKVFIMGSRLTFEHF